MVYVEQIGFVDVQEQRQGPKQVVVLDEVLKPFERYLT
jgi:hypothetical protein